MTNMSNMSALMRGQIDMHKEERVHRVGSITAGLSMIIWGIMFALNELNILTDLRFVLSVWPLILIGLGAEMLWFTSKDERVIYDKGAVLLMIGMSFFAMMMAAVNICIKYSFIL